MKFSIILLAFVCTVNLHMVWGGEKEMQNCASKIASIMQKFLNKGLTGGNINDAKEEMCPALKDFFKCALKASSDSRPSDEDLKDLKKQLAANTQQIKNVDCGININQMADEVWNAAGIARPLSTVALALAVFVAMFVSKGV
ncbi:hypothetical protein ElyMa_006340500 [Elysia marginata]|uniref:Uncharacterized protein n=1 Tax=Elysia marginata TaxID=1093978 RepID=A0AAV4HMQ8_9GAST|nr:hypothetical protein ElyMa_006340500 [Elysia marginata]